MTDTKYNEYIIYFENIHFSNTKIELNDYPTLDPPTHLCSIPTPASD